MANAPQLDISIVEAELVRIFDSFKQTQDLYVQLVCGYEDGSEKNVGRTEVCKNTGRQPKWDERFLCGRGQGKTLKFKVFVDHMWRSPTLCGEAEYDLDMLWARATSKKQKLTIPLYKKGDQTGVMTVTMRLQDNSCPSMPPTPVAREAPAPREAAPHAQMPGQMLPLAGVAPHQAAYEARCDPWSAEQQHQRLANAGALRPTQGQDMNYHMAPQMQPLMPQRQEERRQTPQAQDYPMAPQMQPPMLQRHEERRQTPQAQEPQRRPEDRRQTVQTQDARFSRFEEDRSADPRCVAPRQGVTAYPNAGGQPHNLAALAPPLGGYNATANAAIGATMAPRGGDRGLPDRALIPDRASPPVAVQQAPPQNLVAQAPPNAERNATTRMQPTQHPQQQHKQQQYPQQPQVPTRAEPAARSPPTAPPTSAQARAQGAPAPAPAPAIGKSGQWWNSFIDRG